MRIPQEWNLLKVVSDIVVNWESIAILYPCTATFRAISDHVKKSEDQIAYMSWHEIYTAAHLANSDVRHMQRVKQVLKDSKIVIAIDPPALPGVEEQVQGHTDGCLLFLSQGDRE